MRCQNCSWNWDIEKDDTHPFLCHKCGYDSYLNDFDIFSFMKWKKENGYLNESDPKVGTGKKPKGSGRRLYTDENPNDTVSVKFRTKEDIVDTLNKSSFKNKSHKRQSQIINLIHQRVRAAYNNAKNEETKKRLKRGLDYITDKKEKSKEKTKRQTESYLPFDEYIEEGYHIRTFYDDTDETFDTIKDKDYSHLKEKFVKIIVVNKDNPYWFDVFLDEVHKQEPLHLSVVDDHKNIDLLDDDEIENVEDTLTILNKYVDSMDIQGKKRPLNDLMKTLYNEALDEHNYL